MADEDQSTEATRSEFPTARVKRIVKLDPDIGKITSEALFLLGSSAELFLQFLAERSAEVIAAKKRRTVKLDDLVAAVKRHRPTSDFLLDSLPTAAPPEGEPAEQNRPRAAAEKPLPVGTRRIDEFFRKSGNEAPIEVDETLVS